MPFFENRHKCYITPPYVDPGNFTKNVFFRLLFTFLVYFYYLVYNLIARFPFSPLKLSLQKKPPVPRFPHPKLASPPPPQKKHFFLQQLITLYAVATTACMMVKLTSSPHSNWVAGENSISFPAYTPETEEAF